MLALPYEIWDNIPGFSGFQASSMGHYRSLDREVKCVKKGTVYFMKVKGQNLIPQTQWDNRQTVTLRSDNGEQKIMKTGRVTALTFIPNPNNLPQVNHKDENPQNNQVSNLEWCTMDYNLSYGTRLERIAKSKWKKVNQYDIKTGQLIKTWDSIKAIEDAGLGIAKYISSSIRKGHNSGGYFWRFAD